MLPHLLLDILQHYLVHVVLAVSVAALVYWVTFRARGVPTITRADYVALDCGRERWLLQSGYTDG